MTECGFQKVFQLREYQAPLKKVHGLPGASTHLVLFFSLAGLGGKTTECPRVGVKGQKWAEEASNPENRPPLPNSYTIQTGEAWNVFS